MGDSVRLTAAQALLRFLCAQRIQVEETTLPLIAGVWAIFGHGNVAGLGEALYAGRDTLPTYRAHNEQAMAHAAIAFAKSRRRRQFMACTSSAGPGATNMVTAAAVAHVNRLPVLFLPGDTFATRAPDPVLQQLEVFSDYTITTNDCFKPVSRFFDRIMRPEQLLSSLPQAIRVLTDPVDCGPVTLVLPQDVQTMAFDYPSSFFNERVHRLRSVGSDADELAAAVARIRQSRRPLIIVGGGVHYAAATVELRDFVDAYGVPVCETQAGKGALRWDHPANVGAIGVTGADAANALAAEADLIIAIGTRLGDFTSGSRALFNRDARILTINVASFDAVKHGAQALIGDAKRVLAALPLSLDGWKMDEEWAGKASLLREKWLHAVEEATRDHGRNLPFDVEVIGAVNRAVNDTDTVVCAAGGLPGDLHKFWRTTSPGSYHLEYGFSCMGYEIAGGLGAKMAHPETEIFVMVGDGSYLMMNSEIATSVMLGHKLIIVVVDNGGFGCIDRLQKSCGLPGFNNLFINCLGTFAESTQIDFAKHAAALGAFSENVRSIAELEAVLRRAKASDRTFVISIQTDPAGRVEAGGAWWEVAVPEVSVDRAVTEARRVYEKQKQQQHC
jgi:3D-(3,5/4)-trihydroxycyclohexane-1,2-dione acylhydrolase (decyclizing)